MGLWWKHIKDEFTPGCRKGLKFPGDPKAPPKRWWNFWRWRQKWRVLEVKNFQWYYRVEFKDPTNHMYHKGLLKVPYIAVRIGPDPVEFFAHDMGRPERPALELVDVGYYGPRTDFSELVEDEKLKFLYNVELTGRISWI